MIFVIALILLGVSHMDHDVSHLDSPRYDNGSEYRRWNPREEWNYRPEGNCTMYGGVC